MRIRADAAWILLLAAPLSADQFADSVADVSGQVQAQSAAIKPAIAGGRAAAPKAPPKDAALAAVPLAPHATEVTVGDPWTDENRRRMYQWEGRQSATDKVVTTLSYESPLNFFPLLDPIMDPFKKSDADKIANLCKASFKQYWDQIGCVSKEINAFFKGFKFDGLRSPCRSHAKAFDVAFDALNIRRTWTQRVDASGGKGEEHVANLIFINNEQGTFSYVVDTGWFPGKIFPLNDLAVRFHSRHGGGRTDYLDLPAIQPDSSVRYRPAP